MPRWSSRHRLAQDECIVEVGVLDSRSDDDLLASAEPGDLLTSYNVNSVLSGVGNVIEVLWHDSGQL